MKDNKEKDCVELNIYVDCDKLKPEPKDPCGCCHDKKDDSEGCVKINVYVDCGKEKHTYTF